MLHVAITTFHQERNMDLGKRVSARPGTGTYRRGCPYIELMTGRLYDNQPDFPGCSPTKKKASNSYFMPYT